MPGPDLRAIRSLRARLGTRVVHTPAVPATGRGLLAPLGPGARVSLKLELLQHTGSFKVRGALANLLALDEPARARGVCAVSAGNHALAVAHAAAAVGSHAKVVMPQSANPARVAGCRALGAEVVLVPDVHQAFARVERIAREEGRAFIHPFEGAHTVLGTATVALEWLSDVPDLDAVIVPIGGGGLCAGVASAVKRIAPACQVFGVEPEGADTMHRSFAAGSPQAIERVDTIADSLGAPHAAPETFALCRAHVDDLVRVRDDDLCAAMVTLMEDAKLAVEPAGAAATAALLGPLRARLAGRHVGVLVCGANIDPATYCELLARGRRVRAERA